MAAQYVIVKLELGHKATYRAHVSPKGFTHDWSMYVRGADGADIQHFVDKVVFRLHETFDRHVQVRKEPPYTISESGYASFELRVDIHFKSDEEPNMISYRYDLYLPAQGSPPVKHYRQEKLTFKNPPDDFRRRLIQGGGIATDNPSSVAAVAPPVTGQPILAIAGTGNESSSAATPTGTSSARGEPPKLSKESKAAAGKELRLAAAEGPATAGRESSAGIKTDDHSRASDKRHAAESKAAAGVKADEPKRQHPDVKMALASELSPALSGSDKEGKRKGTERESEKRLNDSKSSKKSTKEIEKSGKGSKEQKEKHKQSQPKPQSAEKDKERDKGKDKEGDKGKDKEADKCKDKEADKGKDKEADKGKEGDKGKDKEGKQSKASAKDSSSKGKGKVVSGSDHSEKDGGSKKKGKDGSGGDHSERDGSGKGKGKDASDHWEKDGGGGSKTKGKETITGDPAEKDYGSKIKGKEAASGDHSEKDGGSKGKGKESSTGSHSEKEGGGKGKGKEVYAGDHADKEGKGKGKDSSDHAEKALAAASERLKEDRVNAKSSAEANEKVKDMGAEKCKEFAGSKSSSDRTKSSVDGNSRESSIRSEKTISSSPASGGDRFKGQPGAYSGKVLPSATKPGAEMKRRQSSDEEKAEKAFVPVADKTESKKPKLDSSSTSVASSGSKAPSAAAALLGLTDSSSDDSSSDDSATVAILATPGNTTSRMAAAKKPLPERGSGEFRAASKHMLRASDSDSGNERVGGQAAMGESTPTAKQPMSPAKGQSHLGDPDAKKIATKRLSADRPSGKSHKKMRADDESSDERSVTVKTPGMKYEALSAGDAKSALATANSSMAMASGKILQIAPNGVLLSELLVLHEKIRSLSDRVLIQKVVDIIEDTGMYKITEKSFDFDLCVLDSGAIKKLEQCFF